MNRTMDRRVVMVLLTTAIVVAVARSIGNVLAVSIRPRRIIFAGAVGCGAVFAAIPIQFVLMRSVGTIGDNKYFVAAVMDAFLISALVEEGIKLLGILVAVRFQPDLRSRNECFFFVSLVVITFAAVELLGAGLIGDGRFLARLYSSSFMHVLASAGTAATVWSSIAKEPLGCFVGFDGFIYAIASHGIYNLIAFSTEVLSVVAIPVAVVFLLGMLSVYRSVLKASSGN